MRSKRIIVDGESGCWLWKGKKTGWYGRVKIHGVDGYAHRVMWMLFYGYRTPKDSEVMHRCDRPTCVNPDHLVLGTHRDNMRDAWTKGRQHTWNTLKVACPKGHPYDAKNTYHHNGKRICRECSRVKAREWAMAKRRRDGIPARKFRHSES